MLFRNLEAPLTVGLISYFIYMTFELFARKKERMSLIEKIGQNLTPTDFSVPKFSSLLPTFNRKSFTSLRFGCLFVGIGLGFLVGLFLCLFIHQELRLETGSWERDTIYGVAYGSSVLFFGGFGLLVSYFIESKATKKEEKC